MKNIKKNTIIVLSAIVMASILLLGGCSKGGTNGTASDNLTLNRDVMFSFNSTVDGSFGVANLKGDTLFNIQLENSSYKFDYSLNKTECAGIVNYKEGTGGELYCVTGSSSGKVDDAVYDMRISDDGSAVAYLKKENEDLVLYLYDVANNEKTELSKQVFFLYCISPDGKNVAYATWAINGSEFNAEKYIFTNGKGAETTDAIPLAISNNADYIYYLDTDANLYVKHSENVTQLASYLDYPTLYLNSDYSELLFIEEQDDNYNICFSINGGEKQEAASGLLDYDMVLDEINNHEEKFGNSTVKAFDINTFKNTFADFSSSLLYINDDYAAEEIARYCVNAVSADGKSLLYCTDEGTLYSAHNSNGSLKTEEINCGEIISKFSASGDLSTIYVSNQNNELFLIKNNGKLKKIADNVTSFQSNSSGKIVYYTNSSDSFFYSKNGKEGVSIESLHGYGTFYAYRDTVFYKDYYPDKDGNAIYILDGTNTTLLYSNIKSEENLLD